MPTDSPQSGSGERKAAIFSAEAGDVSLLWPNCYRVGPRGGQDSSQGGVEDSLELVEPRSGFQVSSEEVVDAGL